MNDLPLILLIGENILLILALTIYLTRKCTKCEQIKCIERILTKYCKKCEKHPNIPKDKAKRPTKEQIFF